MNGFMLGFYYAIISSIALFLGSLNMPIVYFKKAGSFIIFCIAGLFCIIFYMLLRLNPPPYPLIIEVAYFIKS